MTSIILAALLFAYQGVGRLLLGEEKPTGFRDTIAAYGIGFLVLSTLFGIGTAQSLSALAAKTLLLGIAGLGLLVITIRLLSRRLPLTSSVAPAIALCAIHALFVGYPHSVIPVDPFHYAFGAAVAFHHDWMAPQNGNLTGIDLPLEDIRLNVALSRAASIAPLWSSVLLNGTVTLAQVYQTSAWLFAITVLVLADTLRFPGNLLLRLVLAAGAVGIYHLGSVAIGQINQAFGVLVMVLTIWLLQNLRSRVARCAAVALASAALLLGYPEILIAPPLYVLAALIVGAVSLRAAPLLLLSASLGAVVVAPATGLNYIEYLGRQSTSGTAFEPLSLNDKGLITLLKTFVLQSIEAHWAVPAVAITVVLAVSAVSRLLPTLGSVSRVWAAAAVIGSPRQVEQLPDSPVGAITRRVLWLSALALALGLVLLTLSSGNPNYGIWKLSAWLGPALLVTITSALREVPAWARVTGLAILLVLSVSRLDTTDSLAAKFRCCAEKLQFAVVEEGTACRLRPTRWEFEPLQQAISESGAAARGCKVEPPPPKATS